MEQTIKQLRAVCTSNEISLEKAQAELATLLSGGKAGDLTIQGAHENIRILTGVCERGRARLAERIVAEGETTDLGNNESRSTGVFANTDGTFTALSGARSKTLKTRAGAERWLARQFGL
jgi:hypothetical protein